MRWLNYFLWGLGIAMLAYGLGGALLGAYVQDKQDRYWSPARRALKALKRDYDRRGR